MNKQGDLLFNVYSCINKKIWTTNSHWWLITNVKHPIVKGSKNLVKNTLKNPLCIKYSKIDDDILLFYNKFREKYFLCIIVRILNGEGFIVTCYVTDKIKEGEDYE